MHTRCPTGAMSRDELFRTASKNRLKYLGLHVPDDVIPLWISNNAKEDEETFNLEMMFSQQNVIPYFFQIN
jgi:hypothetical protein